MKIMKIFGITFIFAFGNVFAINLRKDLPITPKASDLSDHFGTLPSQELYGPKQPLVARLAREGSTPGNCIFSKPITNFNTQIVPSQVIAGDLLNIAPNAVKIITPEIASKIFYNFRSKIKY